MLKKNPDFREDLKKKRAKKETKTKKETKNYLKHRITPTIFIFWLIFGFISGAFVGHFTFSENQTSIVHLSLIYSSEKNTWIAESQGLFYQYWEEKRAENSSLPEITLDFQPYGSGDSLIAILNGEIRPTIWSPASNIWIPILNAKWSSLTESNEKMVENYTRLIYSPVVIASWSNFIEEHNITSFHNLHDLIIENPGLVKMAHTDPRASNSGFMATIMLVSSFLQMDPKKMSIDNLSSPALIKWMSEVEQSAIFYGKSTGFLGKYMRDQGPNALQIAILYENLVQDYSLAAEKRFGQKIVAIYPDEGMLFSDHPFCIMNAKWVSAEQRLVANEYLKFLSQKDMIIKAIQTGFRPINKSLLENEEVFQIYNQSFNQIHGVTSDPSIIHELNTPTDGNVISRIPDLWILTRNSV